MLNEPPADIVYQRPESFTHVATHYCPGCTHGVGHRLVAEVLDEICRKEGVTRDEVVAVGDGSNDRIMVANAGLGIAFNAKEILKKVADGAITKDHMKGVLYCLGISDRDLTKSEMK